MLQLAGDSLEMWWDRDKPLVAHNQGVARTGNWTFSSCITVLGRLVLTKCC